MNVYIIPAVIEDAPAIIELQYQAFASQARLYDNWQLPPLTEKLQQLQERFGDHWFLKAVINDQIVGSVRARQENETCYIARLMVSPQKQRKGIARKLMAKLEEHFATAERFELCTGKKSKGSIELYEKLGYQIFKTGFDACGTAMVYLEKHTARVFSPPNSNCES